MKTKMKLAGFFLALTLGLSLKSTAQTYTLNNNLNCGVMIYFEKMNDVCGIITSGTVKIPRNTSATINLSNPGGSAVMGGNLVIVLIGGAPAPSNHLWVAVNPSFPPCNPAVSGQSGVTANCGPYVVTTTSNSWTIN